MRNRILALVLALAMMAGILSVVASAVPYAPSANQWKDFGQQHIYLYEVTKGEAAPKMDGYVTDSDGYGEPVATYGFRYCTTAQYVTPELEKRPEYKLRNDGTYYVYPTQDSPQEVWNSIQSYEADSPYGYLWTYRIPTSSFSATTSYIYQNPYTLAMATAYHVTADTYKEYTARSQDNHLVLYNAQKLTEEPEDWETNYANYYYVPSGSSYYEPAEATEDGKAPDFSGKTYYSGKKIVVKKLYQNAEGSAGAVAPVSYLKQNHVILPEKVNLYMRYNGTYLYYAIELAEMKHITAKYENSYYYGTTMSNVPAVFGNAYDYSGTISKSNYDGNDATMTLSSTIRTYVSTSTNVKSTAYILRKYGDLDATSIKDVTQVGVDYNVTHKAYVAPVKEETAEEEDILSDLGGVEEETEQEDMTSGTYGTTTYERRIPWKALNGKYDPNTSSTAVPEVFTVRDQITLENNLCSGAVYFSLTTPRMAYYLSSRSSSYSLADYTMRYPNRTGLTEGEDYGTYNWFWAAMSSSYGLWEPYLTDYASITTRKTANVSHFPFTYFTAGQEPSEGYIQPEYYGANIRADGAENQKMRIQINVPQTDKEIEEIGAIIAPAEVARRNQLKLGMSSINYYAEDFAILTGVEEDGTWLNMTTDADKYFAASATPNDSDSYVAQDQYGGKPSGVYTVYTLAADLEKTEKNTDPETGEELGTLYSVVFGGANGEGLFHDFDDFNTFYAIRPYIIYKDGTVVYGEHEYKSVYYIAAWLIQDMLTNYNEQVTGSTTASKQYNMNEMYLATVTDKDGNTLKDTEGKSIYVPTSFLSTSYTPYYGGGERSIYYDETRLQIFRWFAIRLINRANYTSLRPEYYDEFHDDVKVLVAQYVEMFENIWDIVVECENTRYVEMK